MIHIKLVLKINHNVIINYSVYFHIVMK